MSGSSPLLLLSKPEVTQDWPCSESTLDGTAIRGNDCSEPDPMAMKIKELCHSPRLSRYSMFKFSPTNSPESSPELNHKDFSQLTELQNQSLTKETMLTDLSDDSPLSSPELVSSNDSPVTIDRRRYLIINEIITTETKYLDNLNTILSVFMPTFEHVVAARALRLLIPAQLEMLVDSHQEILSSLKQRMSSNTKFYGFVGDIFSRLCGHSNAEFFNMYRVYMGEFKLAMRTLDTLEKDSAQFKEILSLLQQSPLCERLNLASYLLSPIQRLPRYELLLKELMKHTPDDHPDQYYIGEAVNRLHKELMKLNLSIKSCQMACPTVTKKNSIVRRKAMSVLKKKRFVSAANIHDYSSGDSSFAADDMAKPPSLRVQRRLRTIENSSSFCGSDIDVSTSLSSETSMFRRQTLTTTNRAVSCSDLLLEFDSQQRPRNHQMKFRLLTPLASETCTPNSSPHSSVGSRRRASVDSHQHSFFYSSNSDSSLSSSEGKNSDFQDGSLTPTATEMCSTPVTGKDSTLKVLDKIRFLERQEEEEEDEKEGVAAESTDSKHSRKNTWRLSLFKRRKNGSTSKSELKYIKQ